MPSPTSLPPPPLARAVNRLAVAGCGAFFASASSDETVKVWDCRRLEKDVSFRSRLTYTAQVRCGLQGQGGEQTGGLVCRAWAWAGRVAAAVAQSAQGSVGTSTPCLASPHPQAGRITSVAVCQDSQTIASGSASGSIHVWRVEYAARAGGASERYTGIVSQRQVRLPWEPGAQRRGRGVLCCAVLGQR